MKKSSRSLKKLNENTEQFLKQDKSFLTFWSKYFSNKDDASVFIQNCLKKSLTKRMILKVKWYVDIADGIPKVRYYRPALQVIFLIAFAENISKNSFTKKQIQDKGLNSQKLILNFFKHLSEFDRKELEKKFKRTLSSNRHHELRVSSIVSILYQVRNDAVHGEEFWNFSLVDKKHHIDSDKPHWSLLTSGKLGTKKRKHRVDLDIKITYEDLRDIFIRTAIKNIDGILRADNAGSARLADRKYKLKQGF